MPGGWGVRGGGEDSAPVCEGAAGVLRAGCARGVWLRARAAAARLLAYEVVAVFDGRAGAGGAPDHVETIAETAARTRRGESARVSGVRRWVNTPAWGCTDTRSPLSPARLRQRARARECVYVCVCARVHVEGAGSFYF